MSTRSIAFIDKYKPYYIKDFISREKLQSVVQSLIKIDDMNVLITGAGNSGKTSFLYAIIREYYGLEKNQGFPENNVMFINSLKEQGINYFRTEVKTFSQSCCSIYGKKKLIIVDDLDLINEQSQHVFRNYIDKYKHNVNFIAVCSNIHKVVESIQSRLHVLRIEPLEKETVRMLMHQIMEKEHLSITDEAQEYMLSFSKHSIRVVISHLEKIHILLDLPTHTLDIDECKSILSTLSHNHIEAYLSSVREGDLTKGVDILYHIHDYGYSVIDILDAFYSYVKTVTTLDEEKKYKMLPIICKYISIFHNLHEDEIELVMFTNDIISIFA